jgi:aconitase B
MYTWGAVAVGSAVALVLSSAPAFGQAKPGCGPQGQVITPQKVQGQVVKVDQKQNRITVREADGTVHEFQASKETLEEFKAGDRIEANLREAPKCP